MPYLLASRASLRRLNEKIEGNTSSTSTSMANRMPMIRFRPNIVVDGAGEGTEGYRELEPFDEDCWAEMTFGSSVVSEGDEQSGTLTFYGVKPCSRCKLTTVNSEN